MLCSVVILYGVESGALEVNTMNISEALELWIYSGVLKISWTENMINEDVPKIINKDRELMVIIK